MKSREFFATGVQENESQLEFLRTIHLNPDRPRALDFGYGIGRLTQPLAIHFKEIIGVDIAPLMLKLAG
ncbi:MAG: methyltransferase domain-containing protein [Anaerolineales bacterium]|nr:methyltransferase domain-containing protein [Anaerolineales bacterium]